MRAFAGLTVPQYLTDLYAPATAALRPVADMATRHDLPAEGMTLNISRITTPTSVANQATENLAVAEQNADDSLLTIPVQTAGGQQSRWNWLCSQVGTSFPFIGAANNVPPRFRQAPVGGDDAGGGASTRARSDGSVVTDAGKAGRRGPRP